MGSVAVSPGGPTGSSVPSQLTMAEPSSMTIVGVSPTPIASGTTIPTGVPFKFMIYINNRAAARGDVSLRDVLDPAFSYQAGTMKVTNGIVACAADTCTAPEESGIFTVVDGVAAASDGVDADVVSISGATIDVGDANVANGQLNVSANSVWALVFDVQMN